MSLEQIYNREVTMQPHQLGIVIWPDDRLNMQCEDITGFDNDDDKYLTQLSLDMIYTMRVSNGIGLAAPQVGIPANMIVMTTDETHTPLVLINPVIIEQSDDMFEWDEGCLSVPGFFEKRKRSNRVVLKFQDPVGAESEVEFIGLWAFAVQHEMDHLQGEVFVDHLSYFKRARIKSKIRKTLKATNN